MFVRVFDLIFKQKKKTRIYLLTWLEYLLFSAKFGRKIEYVNYLHELEELVQLDASVIPQRVREYVY